MLLSEARETLRRAGASVDEETQLVRFEPELVEQATATAPSSFELIGRSPERTVTLGRRQLVTVPVSSPPAVSDLDGGKRVGSLADFRDLLRLTQHFDVLHVNGPCVEPQDVDLPFRHLQSGFAYLTLTDKAPFLYSRGRGQVADGFELVRIAHGVDAEAFTAAPRCYTVINSNSPRQLDIPMCMGLIDFAAAGQLSVVTPFTLAGAMAPVTLAGALTLQHAEALAGITLTQAVQPGAPVMYGAFTSNVDMKSGAPAFGTPEYFKAALASGQLARRVGLPYRSSAPNASNAVDGQAMYETMISLYGAVLGGCDMLIHAAGWLEGGLTASKEKFILDVEVLQMLAETFAPLVVDDEEIGLDAIAATPPGGHFFGGEHTLQRYRTAFYEPLVSDWSNFGQWTEMGASGRRWSTSPASPVATSPCSTRSLTGFGRPRPLIDPAFDGSRGAPAPRGSRPRSGDQVTGASSDPWRDLARLPGIQVVVEPLDQDTWATSTRTPTSSISMRA